MPALAFLGLSKLIFSTTPAAPVDNAGENQAATAVKDTDKHPRPANLRPVPTMPVQRRPGLVPVPAAAFAPRTSSDLKQNR
ncbi:hypothetical protein [Micromonospora violae]|uniref:hypothetical protein n=1 Tax=Micromonospora violae TaxID=1278207 RepID=UPI001ABFA365|nr:hypothetical protein [Micromonospora violae]